MDWIHLRATARGLFLVALLAGSCRVLWALVREPCLVLSQAWATGGASGISALPFTELLAGLCAGLVLLCWAWLTATTSLLALLDIGQLAIRSYAAAGGRVQPRLIDPLCSAQALVSRLCPRLGHRLVLAACGIALGSGLATSPAHANSGSNPHSNSGSNSGSNSWGRVDGLVVPDRTVEAVSVAHPTTQATEVTQVVEVDLGDSLWSISEQLLPATSSDAEISAACQELYETNLALVGPDPDLIHPGTTLRVPPLGDERKEQP